MYIRAQSARGDVAVYIVVMLVTTMLLLTAALRLALTAATASSAWDVRRQRELEARSVAIAAKEAVMSVAELAPTLSTSGLAAELTQRVNAIAAAATGISITSSANNALVSIPDNPQWPAAAPVAVAPADFNIASSIGRNLQVLLSAGSIADLGTRTLTFSETNNLYPTDATSYSVALRFFSVPVSNFTWIAYGRPSQSGGVSAGPPATPPFTRGADLIAPLVTAYSAEAGTFPNMFSGTGSALPYFYRDLVSLTWNAFEFWTSTAYQNILLTAAGSSVFDFTSPAQLPSGVTWDGTRASLDLNATSANIVIFADSLGGSIIHLGGASATGAPVVVVVRNFSATPTIIEVAGNNSRTVLLYAPNSSITPLSIGLNFRGGVLLFPNSSVAPSLAINGFVAYPQSLGAAPALVAYPDDQAKLDLANIVPHALLVSTRGSIQ